MCNNGALNRAFLRSSNKFSARRPEANICVLPQSATRLSEAAFNSVAFARCYESLKPEQAVLALNKALQEQKCQREQQFAEEMRRMHFSLSDDSLVMWNGAVALQECDPVHDDQLPAIQLAVTFERKYPEKSSMQITTTKRYLNTIECLHKTSRNCPVAVKDIGLPQPWQRVLFAALCVRNTCLLRVT